MHDRLMRVVGNYETKLRLSAGGHLSEGQIRERVGRYAAHAVSEDCQLSQVRQALCSAGVSTIMFAYYHAFSRELARLTRQQMPAEALATDMMMTVAKWTARGLEQAVLLDIARSVFHIHPPYEPGEEGGEATH